MSEYHKKCFKIYPRALLLAVVAYVLLYFVLEIPAELWVSWVVGISFILFMSASMMLPVGAVMAATGALGDKESWNQ